jgi:hypothetical protein
VPLTDEHREALAAPRADPVLSEPLAPALRTASLMDERSFEERLDNFEVRVRRQAVVIERLATEVHALLMVLAQKKLITLDEVYAAERRLDLASEVAQVQQIANATRDLESLDAELRKNDRRSDAA